MGWYRFDAERLAVQDEFNFVAVALDPDVDGLSLFARPIPMGVHVNGRFIPPPRFVVIVGVLRKSAHVHDPEMAVNTWPAVWSGLTFVVKTRPHKTAFDIWAICNRLPSDLGRLSPRWSIYIVSTDIPFGSIVHVFATSTHGAGSFTPEERLVRKLRVESIVATRVVVPSLEIFN
jgi:hypothetical protein